MGIYYWDMLWSYAMIIVILLLWSAYDININHWDMLWLLLAIWWSCPEGGFQWRSKQGKWNTNGPVITGLLSSNHLDGDFFIVALPLRNGCIKPYKSQHFQWGRHGIQWGYRNGCSQPYSDAVFQHEALKPNHWIWEISRCQKCW
jgi:hypothetical protein